MAMKMYAQVDNQGTAMSETALCDLHAHRSDEFTYPEGVRWVECSGNDELYCNVCGRGRHAAYPPVGKYGIAYRVGP